jgi:sterol desaturase/sphingolipid hydroxylase (fatty acid hydroxylase superfamily)
MIEIPNLSNPLTFLVACVVLFAVIVGRYLIVAVIFHVVFNVWQLEKWKQRKLIDKKYKPGQLKKEIAWSTVTASLFAVIGALTILLWQMGYTKVYTRIDLYGWFYLPLSLVIALFIQETYYYWIHRWMHHPSVFRLVHKVHHDSNTTSPFTSFSFHPLEGLLQAIVLPGILLFLPLHPVVILINLLIMTFSSVINHLNIEVYPEHFHNHKLGRWLIGASHHALHHKQFKFNFGLYFTFWDKMGNTESPMFHRFFEKATSPEKKNS